MTMKSLFSLLYLLIASSAAAFDDTADIRALEQQWDTANLRGDAAALDRVLADDFILTGDDGKVHPKAEVISELKSRNITYHSAKTEDLKIILHGDAAVVSGQWRGSYNNRGKTINLLERFTNFYVRRDGQWRCVASHGSAIK
jgi:ketosteroid isomerase-like protein